jgi:hypothetical protein
LLRLRAALLEELIAGIARANDQSMRFVLVEGACM